jgi:hypothetical protein
MKTPAMEAKNSFISPRPSNFIDYITNQSFRWKRVNVYHTRSV